VRAFYMAVPPVSRNLPPGKKAYIARPFIEGNVTIVGLISDNDKVCSAMPFVPFLEKILDDVGAGKFGVEPGQGL
jgi:hypothetical protein